VKSRDWEKKKLGWVDLYFIFSWVIELGCKSWDYLFIYLFLNGTELKIKNKKIKLLHPDSRLAQILSSV
jgi:hypothetical protein